MGNDDQMLLHLEELIEALGRWTDQAAGGEILPALQYAIIAQAALAHGGDSTARYALVQAGLLPDPE
jgi:hypothetical protein